MMLLCEAHWQDDLQDASIGRIKKEFPNAVGAAARDATPSHFPTQAG